MRQFCFVLLLACACTKDASRAVPASQAVSPTASETPSAASEKKDDKGTNTPPSVGATPGDQTRTVQPAPTVTGTAAPSASVPAKQKPKCNCTPGDPFCNCL